MNDTEATAHIMAAAMEKLMARENGSAEEKAATLATAFRIIYDAVTDPYGAGRPEED